MTRVCRTKKDDLRNVGAGAGVDVGARDADAAEQGVEVVRADEAEQGVEVVRADTAKIDPM